ncbi:Calx-beta domain-containing protein [Bacteroides congonensis]|uniref:Calx-beta domain-containing protein n=1 Tax=Bacteroides congonensis TaxID=1871006 RepID=UPI00189C17D5|nr:Calx-beta domain-containing protein [Bacteroides congonensis]
MKYIIYNLWILMFLFACSESEQVEYSKLSVGFQKSKIDVGENTGILEIPVVLSGANMDMPLQVSVQVSATDGDAVAGVDYELIDTQLAFEVCGQTTLKVRIMDNEEITDVVKTFTVNLKAETPEVKSGISSIKVYIISDDVEKVTMAGHYTLTAQDFVEGTKLSSTPGGVEIVQDLDDSNKYYMRNMVLVNGDKVLPLTMGGDLYFTVDNSGNMAIPSQLKIGNYGDGEAFAVGLTTEGYFTEDPIKIEKKDNRLFIMGGGLAGIFIDDKDDLSIYYALKNIILEKVNH